MKISGKDIDISRKEEQYRALEYIRMKKIKTLPLLSYILIGCSKFEDSLDCDFYGWSVFNPSSQFYTIKLNWKKIADDNLPVEILEFIAYHNVLHHMLLHFVREPIVRYYQESPRHADICMDTVINEYLLCHLGFNKNAIVRDWVEKYAFTYTKFLTYFQLQKLPFNIDIIVPVEKLISCAKDFEKQQESVSSKSNQQDKKESIKKGSEPRASSENDDKDASEPDTIKEQDSQEKNSLDTDSSSVSQNISIPKILDDHYRPFNENEELRNKASMSHETLEELFLNSQDNIVERAIKQGIIPTREEERFIATLKTKVNYLSVVKLKNLSSSFSKGKRIVTWSKIHRHKKFFTGIHYPAKKIETKKHVVYAIDTSGSISDDELKSIKSVIINHAKQYEDEIVCDIIVWSGTVTNVYKNIVSIKEIIELKTTSTWSTNIDKLFEYIEKQYTKKIICVILTDGYISQERVPQIIEKIYFALIKQDSLETIRAMYPMAISLSLVI